jgi:hypothetical protein
MDKIKLTQEQYKYLGIGNAASILLSMEDFLNELVSALDDDEASGLCDALLDRVNTVYEEASGIVQFDVEG